jgi:NAD(P)-dependent dehydrogenase (short-subunit alcohol dehydrogenase family)
MTTGDPSELLRADVLRGVRMLVVGAHPASGDMNAAGVHGGEAGNGDQPDGLAAAVHRRCAALGAEVRGCSAHAEGDGALELERLEAALDRAIHGLGGLDRLVVDAAGLFAAGSLRGTHEGLVGCLETTWSITRAVAAQAFIAPGAAGRIVLLAPRPPARSSQDSGHRGAALAGLENLARTLSIEWARYGITPVTVAPGLHTTAHELADLTAYLASPAGGYFSGCLLDLRGPEAKSRS